MLAQRIAYAATARNNCEKFKNPVMLSYWAAELKKLACSLPSGAGFHGMSIDEQSSDSSKITICFFYDRMDEHGYQTGADCFSVEVKSNFVTGLSLDFSGSVTAPSLDDLDYFHEVLDHALNS